MNGTYLVDEKELFTSDVVVCSSVLLLRLVLLHLALKKQIFIPSFILCTL